MIPVWWHDIPLALRPLEALDQREPHERDLHFFGRSVLYVVAGVFRASYAGVSGADPSVHQPWDLWLTTGHWRHLLRFLNACGKSHLLEGFPPTIQGIAAILYQEGLHPYGLLDFLQRSLEWEEHGVEVTPALFQDFKVLLTGRAGVLHTAQWEYRANDQGDPEPTLTIPHVGNYGFDPFFHRAALSTETGILFDVAEGLEYVAPRTEQFHNVDICPFWAREGRFFRVQADLVRAERWLRQAWQRGHQTREVRSNLALCIYRQAFRIARDGKRDQALRLVDEGLTFEGDNQRLLWLKGHCLYKDRRYDDVLTLLKQSLRRSDVLPEIFELYGKCLERTDNAAGALRTYKKGMQQHPNNQRLRRAFESVSIIPRGKEESMAGSSGNDEKQFQFSNFVIDLVDYAARAGIRPLPARNNEFGQVLDTLACWQKRNVLLVGEAGVGKSAVVLELARQIAEDELGKAWSSRKLFQLNVASLVAGARFRGQYEERLLELVEALKRMPEAILFIDDMHTFFNSAGNRSGNLDPSHVFKPALALGEIQIIGATSEEHFRLNLANDPAILRSFQVIRVKEPDREHLNAMISHVAERLEEFHDVIITPEASASALELSRVFIRDRALPDKALNLLDMACVLAKNHADNGEEVHVTSEHLLKATAKRSGIPASKIATRDTSRFLEMEEFLRDRIVGQDAAIEAVSRVLRVSRMNLQLKSEQPDGVFLFAGPTGVGKTELALAMTEFLFGDRDRMIRIDMSEFMEHISTSKLIGISPGYVGYHDKTQLTDRVRQEPYSLVLLDEIEKASPQVMNLFLQVFDTGRLTDSKGGTVYFDHTVFVLTSNLGTELYGRSVVGYGSNDTSTVSPGEMMRAIKAHLSPEFINRLDEKIFFNPLRLEDMERILDQNLATIQQRLRKEHNVSLIFNDQARRKLVDAGFSPEFGARELHRTIRSLLLDPLARFLMERSDGQPRSILVAGPDLEQVEQRQMVEADVIGVSEGDMLSFNFVE